MERSWRAVESSLDSLNVIYFYDSYWYVLIIIVFILRIIYFSIKHFPCATIYERCWFCWSKWTEYNELDRIGQNGTEVGYLSLKRLVVSTFFLETVRTCCTLVYKASHTNTKSEFCKAIYRACQRFCSYKFFLPKKEKGKEKWT